MAKKAEQQLPEGPFRFTPVEQFDYELDGKMIARYLPGQGYQCVNGREGHDKLREKCKVWLNQKLIKLGA